MLARILLVLLTVAAAAPAAARERPGLDAYERLNLPPGRAGQVARRDLEAMLGPDAFYTTEDVDTPRSTQVYGQLFTRPEPTLVSGLCRRTMLVIVNDRIEGTATGNHMDRVRPVELRTHTQYRVIDGESHFRIRPPADNSCRDFDPRMGRGWFYAEDETVAYRSFEAIRRAAAAIREGRITVTDCDQGAQCAQNVLHAAIPENITNVGACPDDHDQRCYEISSQIGDSRNYWITVELTGAYRIEEVARVTIHWALTAI
jgi:hypothetical protein